MNSLRKITILRHLIYCMMLGVFYVIQSVPHLFDIGGVKPYWVISVAVATAMFEGEFVGGVYGALAGILCDLGGFSLFGFNGFIVCLCCTVIGLVVIYLMRCTLAGFLSFVFITMLVRGSIEYLFLYGMWGYDRVALIYLTKTLPTVIYSVIVSPTVYFIVKKIHRVLN